MISRCLELLAFRGSLPHFHCSTKVVEAIHTKLKPLSRPTMAWKIFSSSLLALGAIATSSLTHGVAASSEAAQACAVAGGNCGNAQVGPNCCPSGQFCQPWNPGYYQCIPKPAKCGMPEVGTDYFGATSVKRLGSSSRRLAATLVHPPPGA